MRFIEGLHTDNEPLVQPQGTWRHMLNGLINKSRGAATGELGNELIVSLPQNHEPIGKILMDDDKIIVFSVNTNTDASEIGVFKEGDYQTLLNDSTFASTNKLNFPVGGYIEGEFRINSRLETLIYWTDGVNYPRFLNISDIPELEFDVDNLNLFARIEQIAKFTLDQVNNAGGNLVTGAYQFAFAYVDDDLTATNYFTVSNPVFVIDDTTSPNSLYTDGAPAGTPTSKSITFTLNNIDGNYKYVRIAVIKGTEVQVLPDVLIPDNDELTYTYSGGEAYTAGDIAEVLINKVSYDRAQVMRQVDGILYLGNLSGKDDIDYQKYANNIVVEAVTEELDPAVTGRGGLFYWYFRDEEAAHYDRGFQRDEIYAFYISFMLKDGSETRAFHIPGREPLGGSAQGVGSIQVDYEDIAGKARGEINVLDVTAPSPGYVSFVISVDGVAVNFDMYVDGSATVQSVANTIISYLIGEPGFTQNWTIAGDSDVPNGQIIIESKEGGTTWNGRSIVASSTPDGNTAVSLASENTSGGTDANGYTGTVDITIGAITIETSLAKAKTADAIASSIRSKINLDPNFIASIDPQDATKVIVRTADNTADFNGPITTVADPIGPTFTNEDIVGGSGGGEIGDFNDAEFDALPNPKTFHMTGNPLANGMAYWHNENERYPTDDDWEVWQVNGGVGEPVIEADGAVKTLAGKKVRHHHFPSTNYTPLWDGAVTDPEDAPPVKLGFRLTNVQIPDDIKDKVLGYKVYYAKRSASNRTILGQSLGIYGKEGEQDPDPSDADATTRMMYLPQKDLESLPSDSNLDDILYLHPFRMMKAEENERPNIGSLTHLKPVREYTDFWTQPQTTEDQFYVDAKAYAEVNALIYLEALGFNHDLYNIEGEKKLIVDLANPVAPKVNYIWNLVAFRQDTYNSFDRQELVWTGYFEDDLEAANSDDIYGGDTYIVEWQYRGSDGPTNFNREEQREYVECIDNALWRHAGPEPHQIYSLKYWNGLHLQQVLPEEYDNASQVEEYYGYNDEYSQINDTKPSIPSLKEYQEVNEYPTRVIRSAKEDVSGVLDNFRRFLENDFLDLPRNKGEITALKNLNGVLAVHFERDLMRTRGREELVTGDFRAYLGSGDIFSVQPQSIVNSDIGYGGLQDRETAIVTQYGYFFVDREAGRVFLLSDGLNEISTKGMREWFKENLKSPLEKYGYNEDTSYNSHIELRATYDPVFDRIILTKKDLKPTQLFLDGYNREPAPIVRWNDEQGAFEDYDNNTENWDIIPTGENTYFEDASWTISYLLEQNIWISYHDYHPDFYMYDLNHFYSVIGNEIWEHHKGNAGHYYGEIFDFEIEFVENQEPQESKLIASLDIDCVIENGSGEVHDRTFDSVRIRNRYQDSGEVDLIPFTNCRRTRRVWHVNGFRDISNTPSEEEKLLPAWTYKRRFEDKYHIVKLAFRNLSENVVYLYNAYLKAKPSNR